MFDKKQVNPTTSIIPSFSQVFYEKPSLYSVRTVNSSTNTDWKPWGRPVKAPKKTVQVRKRVTKNFPQESPEEIARYIEERRKRWPGATRATMKQVGTVEKQPREPVVESAVQLIAQAYGESETIKENEQESTTSQNKCSSEEPTNKQRQAKKNKLRYATNIYRPNLFSLFIEKHVEKQRNLLIDFIRFLDRENFLQTS